MKKGFTPLEIYLSSGLKKEKKRRVLTGFTLIELLVVIVIIGMVASIILVVLNPARKKARDSRGQTDLRQMMTAFEMKYSDDKIYPDLPDAPTEILSEDTRLAPYLSPAPYTNGKRIYSWYDDGDNQKFCVYFQLEADTSKYFYVSYKGSGETNSAACPNF